MFTRTPCPLGMTEKAEQPGTLSGQLGRRQPAKAWPTCRTHHRSLFAVVAPGTCRPGRRWGSGAQGESLSPDLVDRTPACPLLGMAAPLRCHRHLAPKESWRVASLLTGLVLRERFECLSGSSVSRMSFGPETVAAASTQKSETLIFYRSMFF